MDIFAIFFFVAVGYWLAWVQKFLMDLWSNHQIKAAQVATATWTGDPETLLQEYGLRVQAGQGEFELLRGNDLIDQAECDNRGEAVSCFYARLLTGWYDWKLPAKGKGE